MTATLFDLPDALRGHPAKYTDVLLTTFARLLRDYPRILDPFGGTGKVFLLEHWLPLARIDAVELEPEWAAQHPRTTLGNALHLPWQASTFDAICTSPTYGNRMADHHNAQDASRRRTYTHVMGRSLHPDNSGALDWGDKYRAFHVAAWTEARRVLRPGGRFVLNIKDHIRSGERQHVTAWHIGALQDLGFTVTEHVKLPCPGMRYGRHGDKRIEYESIIAFDLQEDTQP